MYKVLLAEDELLVRIGLKNSINWPDYDMEIAAEDENGYSAYQKYQALKPDVLITDIRMPVMDGLELIRKIREEDPRCAVIVISCMNDFKLLQDIIRYDVLGYVLKASMTIKEVEELLLRAKRRLDHFPPAGWQPVREPRSRVSLLTMYVNRTLSEQEFEAEWKREGYPQPEFSSITVFHILPLNAQPLNEMAISFIKNVIHESLPDSDILWKDACAVAFHPNCIQCTDSRFGRISQMIQSFLEGAFSQITHKLNCSFSSLPMEVEAIVELCRFRKPDLDRTVFRAVDYILNHYRDNLTLAAVASYVGLSPNYFSSLFKKETGISFVNYLNDIRIEKAKLLLSNTDEYLYVIAYETGFHTVEHFSQTFKLREGINPGDYRKKRGIYGIRDTNKMRGRERI